MKSSVLPSTVLVLLLLNHPVLGQQWQGPNDATGNIGRAGSVGVGMSNPAAQMHISSEQRYTQVPGGKSTRVPVKQLVVDRTLPRRPAHTDFAIYDGNVGIGTALPQYPLSFADVLGDKISLWGQGGSHYGFGIQNHLLQIYTDLPASDIVFGFGSSSSFTETMRVKGNGMVEIGAPPPAAAILHVLNPTTATNSWNAAVFGDNPQGSVGVEGHGLWGVNGVGPTGVRGLGQKSGSGGAAGVNDGTIGVLGASAWSVGVQGETNTGRGVYGVATGFGVGVVGEGPAGGVKGTSGPGSNAVWGVNPDTGPGSYAVYAEGEFGVANGAKCAIVQTRDYGTRKLYAVESPENWFEDFGTAKMVDGRAVVTIDPIFAQTVNLAADYHVFLTPRDGFAQLFVTNLTREAFEVRDAGGRASLSFSYRIVAKRAGFENRRLDVAAAPGSREPPASLDPKQKK